MTDVHVCRAVQVSCDLKKLQCPVCERRTPHVCTLYEWYGWHVTCLSCGDNWADDELLPRPFAPRWREKSKQAARDLYRRSRHA